MGSWEDKLEQAADSLSAFSTSLSSAELDGQEVMVETPESTWHTFSSYLLSTNRTHFINAD